MNRYKKKYSITVWGRLSAGTHRDHNLGPSPILQEGSAAPHRATVTTDDLQKVAVERMHDA